MSITSKLIPFDQIVVEQNVRLEINLNIAPLADDIALNGLRTPIDVVQYDDKEKYFLACGHRRRMAILSVQKADPDAYKKHFGKGIPATVHVGITKQEAVLLKVDHGNEQPLTHPHEAYLCYAMLRDEGLGNSKIAVKLGGLFDRVKPLRAGSAASKDLRKWDNKIKEAKTEMARVEYIKGRSKRLREIRYGTCQQYGHIYDNASIVEAAKYYQATNISPKGYEKEYLPNLTGNQIVDLEKEFKKEITEKGAKGKYLYTKDIPGPAFMDKWQEICQLSRDKDAGVAEKQDRPMAKKQMIDMLETAEFSSNVIRMVISMCSGNKAAKAALKAVDHSYRLFELVEEHDKGLFQKVLESGKAILTREKDNDKIKS